MPNQKELGDRLSTGAIIEVKGEKMDGKTVMEVVMEAASDAKMDEATMSKLGSLVLPEVMTVSRQHSYAVEEYHKIEEENPMSTIYRRTGID